jgi:glycosyltransferase involved in cell wall biosynthesis
VAIKKELNNFDIVHLNEFRSFHSIIVHYYTRKYNIPYVLQAHGSLVTFFYKGWLKKLFDIIWGYRILKDAAKLIALTTVEAEQYRSMSISKDRIAIVPNGIDLSEFDNLPQNGEFRRKYGLDNKQRIVLFIGRIHKIKGPDLLARAFADLVKVFHKTKLVIAGPDDGYLPVLKNLIQELNIEQNVLFTGPLYGTDKLEAYLDADVYVLPSVSEAFPNSVLEACACGTPVIITNRCGIADVIDNQAGFVVPYEKDALAQAMVNILTNDKKRQKLGEQGKLLVREKYNWEDIVDNLETLYRDCISV